MIKRIAIFVDGSNNSAACRAAEFRTDFHKILRYWQERGEVIQAKYFTALPHRGTASTLRKLTDWLQYNGWKVRIKPTKETLSDAGLFRTKGNMDIEIAVDAMCLAEAGLDEFVLFSGDGDFCCLVEELQRRNIHVTAVSHLGLGNSTISDDLRRQVDKFMNLIDYRATFELERKNDVR